MPATSSTTRAAQSAVRRVLVVGHGTLGDCLLRAFTSSDYQQRIKSFLLVRPATMNDAASAAKLASFKDSGVTLLVGDINEQAELVHVLRGAAIDVVVSAVGHSAHLDQLSLLAAVKAAGVQRFFPSEFGFDEADMDVEHSPLRSLLHNKRQVREAMLASGVDWTVVLVGAFLEWFVDSAFFGFDLANNTVIAPGSLSAAITLTSLRDIGRLTADAVLDDGTRNSVVRLGQPITYQQAADIVDATYNSSPSRKRPAMTRTTKTIDDRQREVEADPHNLPARFAILLATQKGISWPEQETYSNQRAYQQRTFTDAVRDLTRAE